MAIRDNGGGPRDIDAVFLDGAVPYLECVRARGNGYLSSAILTVDGKETKGHEVTFRA